MKWQKYRWIRFKSTNLSGSLHKFKLFLKISWPQMLFVWLILQRISEKWIGQTSALSLSLLFVHDKHADRDAFQLIQYSVYERYQITNSTREHTHTWMFSKHSSSRITLNHHLSLSFLPSTSIHQMLFLSLLLSLPLSSLSGMCVCIFVVVFTQFISSYHKKFKYSLLHAHTHTHTHLHACTHTHRVTH